MSNIFCKKYTTNRTFSFAFLCNLRYIIHPINTGRTIGYKTGRSQGALRKNPARKGCMAYGDKLVTHRKADGMPACHVTEAERMNRDIFADEVGKRKCCARWGVLLSVVVSFGYFDIIVAVLHSHIDHIFHNFYTV